MKKKVIVFLQSEVGGAERVSVTIGKNLGKDFFDVCFYAVGPWKCNIADFIPSSMFKEHLKYANPFKLLVNLYETLRRESPDVVFASTMYINTKLLMLRNFFPKIKFIVRSENNFFSFNKKQQIMIRLMYRRADKIIAQTEEMRKELIEKAKLPQNRVVAIQNPQDFNSISALANEDSPFMDKEKIYYVASGRFALAKGFDILVMAFAQVLKKIKNAELYIVGRNTDSNEDYYLQIKKQIDDLGLCEKVHCVGYQKNPYVFVKNANCFVLSSRNEGLPNVLIEALYLGTPAAATTCIPAIERIVENGKTGFLAVPENAESLADAMLKAVSLGRVKSESVVDTMPKFADLFTHSFES